MNNYKKQIKDFIYELECEQIKTPTFREDLLKALKAVRLLLNSKNSIEYKTEIFGKYNIAPLRLYFKNNLKDIATLTVYSDTFTQYNDFCKINLIKKDLNEHHI